MKTETHGAGVLGVIGGSGLYEIEGLVDVEEVQVRTPYGPPSDAIVRGRLGETTLLFLPRHGRGHRAAPHAIPFRANVCAMKKLGATHLVSISAVGSMKEEIAPGDFVIVDQFIDLTKRRVSTFFEDGIVGHVGFADPVCATLSGALAKAAGHAGARVHEGGTYVCIEGPQFSTRAESLLYRSWGVSVIGMTAHARGQARPGGRAAVRAAGPRHRLRLLARQRGGRQRRGRPRGHGQERREGPGGRRASWPARCRTAR